MADFNSLSDRELRAKLLQYGLDAPVTASTRPMLIKKLKSAVEGSSNGRSPEERVESRPSSVRRRSAAKPKSRTRHSIGTSTSFRVADAQNDESDDTDHSSAVVKKQSVARLSPEKNEAVSNGTGSSFHADQISDEELMRQLAKYNISCPAITHSTRPILIKKLNHAIVKSKRQSKLFSPPSTQSSLVKDWDDEAEQDSEKDYPDNSILTSSKPSMVSSKINKQVPTVPRPELSFSKQHSLTMGNYGSLSSFDSKSKLTSSPDTSSLFIPTSSVVINRFVEEQEASPYDTGSDSEAECREKKARTPKKNWPLSSWFSSRKSHPVTHSTPVKKESFAHNVKTKLSMLAQWQFVAVVLPVLALLFFLSLAAFYIRASYGDQTDSRDVKGTAPAVAVEPDFEQAIATVKNILEGQFVQRTCVKGDDTVTDSAYLIEQSKFNSSFIDRIRNYVETNPQFGINVDGDVWDFPAAKLPIWCTVKWYLWNLFVTVLGIAAAIGVIIAGHTYVSSVCQRREKEEQEVYSLVEMIIDLLARHHAAKLADNHPHDAFLAVTHVRDVLIPLKDRKNKLKLWNRAVQFLEDNESRVRAEIQQIEGEDYRVWRWLPPSMNYTSKGTVSGADQTNEDTGVAGQRPKVWQGPAFSTGSSGVNAPPPYPLTQCLKVRNMFEAEVEIGDSWPVRIQDAVLEKAEGAKILHLAVDKNSREGCVYIKCASAEDAGKVYRALHGWWFDGSLVTVKYLRPERYHYRFPDSIQATIPLQPSNDKRLSLQTKFWKSPLEHF